MADDIDNTIHDDIAVKNFGKLRDKIALTADVEGAGKKRIHG